MKELSFSIITIIERAYKNEKECNQDEIDMKKNGFDVIESSHEIYQYYRKYTNTL